MALPRAHCKTRWYQDHEINKGLGAGRASQAEHRRRSIAGGASQAEHRRRSIAGRVSQAEHPRRSIAGRASQAEHRRQMETANDEELRSSHMTQALSAWGESGSGTCFLWLLLIADNLIHDNVTGKQWSI